VPKTQHENSFPLLLGELRRPPGRLDVDQSLRAVLVKAVHPVSSEELRRRCDLQMRDIPSSILDFIERYETASPRQLTLRLSS
jgi:hypothetical protein